MELLFSRKCRAWSNALLFIPQLIAENLHWSKKEIIHLKNHAAFKNIITALIGKKGIERLKSKEVILFFRKGNIEKTLKNMIKNELFNK